MSLRRVLAFLAGFLLAGIAAAVTVDAVSSDVVSQRYGFAVWPVDTASEADEECSFFDPITWRGSAEKTGARFASEVLANEDADVETRIEGDTASLALTGGGISLEQGVSLRRESGCWYVTHVSERESFSPPGSIGYAGTSANRRVYLHVPFEGAWVGSLGVGSVERRFDTLQPHPDGGGFMLTLPATEGEAGHFVLGSPGVDPPTLDPANGGLISPPFDPSDLPAIPKPEGSRRILFESVRRARDCRGWYWEEFSEKHAIRQTLPIATHYTSEAPPFELRREGRNNYIATLGGVDIDFEFWRPLQGCHVLGRISSAEKESRVTQVRAGPDACAFSVDWGHADEVSMTCGFGEIYLGGTVGKIAGPIQISLNGSPGIAPRSVRDEPGRYLVAFYDDGHMIDLEGGALPPFEMFGE